MMKGEKLCLSIICVPKANAVIKKKTETKGAQCQEMICLNSTASFLLVDILGQKGQPVKVSAFL